MRACAQKYVRTAVMRCDPAPGLRQGTDLAGVQGAVQLQHGGIHLPLLSREVRDGEGVRRFRGKSGVLQLLLLLLRLTAEETQQLL